MSRLCIRSPRVLELHMHLAIWGQSCFLYCSQTNFLFIVRDGKCGGWLPLSLSLSLSLSHTHTHTHTLSTVLSNTWLCFTWAHKFALHTHTLTHTAPAGFQKPGFVSSGLRHLHLKKAYSLVGRRAKNISFPTGNSEDVLLRR